MSTPEGKLRDKAMKWLRSLPDTYVRKISDSVNVGYPDIDGCYKGRAFYFELKTKVGRLTDRQDYELKKIRAAGGRAIVVTSLEEIQNYMVMWFAIDEIYCASIRPKAEKRSFHKGSLPATEINSSGSS